jgi:hypothetical protein
MKKSLNWVLVSDLAMMVIFSACSKRHPTPVPRPETTFQFKANGVSYQWSG